MLRSLNAAASLRMHADRFLREFPNPAAPVPTVFIAVRSTKEGCPEICPLHNVKLCLKKVVDTEKTR
jgi:hypothetical protein